MTEQESRRECIKSFRLNKILNSCQLLFSFDPGFTLSYCPISLLLKLLGITIQHEKPQLEVQKTELLRKEEELKVQLAELEESLLEVRTTAH